MKKNKSALGGKNIIILFETIENNPNFNEEDKIEFAEDLSILRSQIEARGIKTELAIITSTVDDALKGFDPYEWVVFNWCEGLSDLPKSYHLVPPELEKSGFVYTGSGADALYATQSKCTTKNILVKNQISTPKHKIFKRSTKDFSEWDIFPAIVKPESEHCSDGITKDAVVDNLEQLKYRIEYVFTNFKGNVLVEEFIKGTEYLVPVWGSRNDIEALTPVHVDYSKVEDYHEQILSFDAKWDTKSQAFTEVVQNENPVIEKELENKLKDVAIQAFTKTECRGYARMDIRVKDGIPYVVDVNPNPYMAKDGEIVLAASKQGLNYGDTIIRLCEFALQDSALVEVDPDQKENLV